ncbi:MAG: hypothetical protein Q8P20_04675 [bacterium]|nr:hypothetical protein [bacterium]
MIIKINKKFILVISIGLILVIGIVITVISNPGTEASSNGVNTIISDINTLAINSTSNRQQTATMGAVTVNVEPLKLGLQEDNNIFSASLNTHSVELEFNFTDIITLADDLGNSYKALEWTGNSGWHHVSGDIIFPSINKQASKVILTINGIEGLTQTFEWEII